MNTDTATDTTTDANLSIRMRNSLAHNVRRLAAGGVVAVVGSVAFTGVVSADENTAVIDDPIIGEVDDEPNELESEIDELQAYLTPHAATKVKPKLPTPAIAPNPQMTIPGPPKPVLKPHPEMAIPWPVPGSENTPEQVTPENPATSPQDPGAQTPWSTAPGPGQGGVPVAGGQTPGSAAAGPTDAATTAGDTASGSAPAENPASPRGAGLTWSAADADDRNSDEHSQEASVSDTASMDASVPFLAAGLIAGAGLLDRARLKRVVTRTETRTSLDT